MEYKQVIIVRKDLNMRKGKMVAQGAHASIGAYLEALAQNPAVANIWISGLSTKVCVGVPSEQELQLAYSRAIDAGLPAKLIVDAGKTEFGGVPTKTAVAIGPGPVEEIDAITGEMSLL